MVADIRLLTCFVLGLTFVVDFEVWWGWNTFLPDASGEDRRERVGFPMNEESTSISLPPKLIEESIKVFEDSLRAVRRVRAGGGVYEDQPDFKTRMAAAELLLAYEYGKPAAVNRNLNANVEIQAPDQGRGSDDAAIIKKLVDAGMGEDTIAALMRKFKGSERVALAKPVDIAEDIDI